MAESKPGDPKTYLFDADAAMGRINDVVQKLTVLQGNTMEQSRLAIDELAKLGRAQIEYSLTLTKNLQQLALSQTRQALDLTAKVVNWSRA